MRNSALLFYLILSSISFLRPHIWAFILDIVVIANHQSGRDTHIRQLRVFGPRTDPIKALGFELTFTTPEFNQVAFIR